MKKKIIFNLIATFFYFLSITHLKADFRINMLEKYKKINTLSFEFTQTIGEKIEMGDCYIKYPLLMKCEYPKKKKIIITNGRKLAIIKKRYNKIHQYPLKKTPLYYLLKKENILNIIKNYEPTIMTSKEIEYEIIDENSNKLNIFFDRESLERAGWKTIDSYSNQVNFVFRNIKTNIFVDNKIFKIPKEEDL